MELFSAQAGLKSLLLLIFGSPRVIFSLSLILPIVRRVSRTLTMAGFKKNDSDHRLVLFWVFAACESFFV
jgi:hypothetical protein